MASHRYKVGQSVRLSPRKGSLPAGAQAYKIVRVLPAEGNDTGSRARTRRSSGSLGKASSTR